MEQERKLRKILVYAGVILLCIGILVIFFKWLFLPLLPFLLAALLSWPVVYLSDKLEKKTKIRAKFWCILLLTVFCLLLFFIIWLTISKLFGELYDFVTDQNAWNGRIDDFFGKAEAFLSKHFPHIVSKIDRTAIEEKLMDALARGVGEISRFLAKAALTLPSAVFFAVVTFLAALYLSIDNRRLKRSVETLLPERWRTSIKKSFRFLKEGVRGYLRAGGYLMMITFAELLFGFLMLDVSFPLLFAVLGAAIDFLPVLGTGVVLAPMAVIAFLNAETFKGFGLLILWGVTTLVREIIEPRFFGKQMQMHPLFSLASTYLGLKLFGVTGLVMMPIIAGISVNIFKKYRMDRFSV